MGLGVSEMEGIVGGLISCFSRFNTSDVKYFAGVRVFCFCRAARRCVFVGTKRVANRIMRSVSMFERKRNEKAG